MTANKNRAILEPQAIFNEIPASGFSSCPLLFLDISHTPFFNNYRPQFYFRTTDVTGVCNLPEGTEMCMPGDNVEMSIELIHPIAMEQGLTFAIRGQRICLIYGKNRKLLITPPCQ